MKISWARLEGRSGHEAGLQLLAQLYREQTGKNCPPILISPRGKPYFADSPLHFSISHTKLHVFCALSNHPIGIDAEEKGREINLRLADKILSPSERILFDAAENKWDTLLRLWVLKEAAAKQTGEGLRGYPNHTDLDPTDTRIQEIDGCYVAVFEGE